MTWSTFTRPSDFVDAAREMADSGRHTLAHLLAEEAADRTPDPEEAARIRAEFPGPSLRQEG
ncbi:hypothetical protein [Streptomyces sp. 2A115]|uniref:hypothetical protein n=1 Tax=Streptomyces sp. 2A115 TaxID=3457439 RepID=UPI003FD3A7AE